MTRNFGYVLGAFFALGTLVLPHAVSAQSAAQIDARLNTVALWQSSNGQWRGCGPSQCVSTGYDSAGTVFGLVAPDSASEYVLRGSIGRCRMYQSGNQTQSWQNSAQRVLDLARC